MNRHNGEILLQIPSSNNLPTPILSHAFDKMSESYKIFWFKAILEESQGGERRIEYRKLIERMIVDAWYMVSEFKLNLGPADTLEKIIKHIFEVSNLKSLDKAETIFAFLEKNDDKLLKTYMNTLTKNVPYRFQAPFMPEISSNIWSNLATTIGYTNSQAGLMYTIEYTRGLDSAIVLDEKWLDYINNNYGILMGWADFNLINYLQRRNPTVPGISSKLYPPQERKLATVTKYWKGIIERQPVYNIYTDEPMCIQDLSIDHFVPWSYIASDELWDLTPTTKSVNSSKSNNLPSWERYFSGLCKVEYDAYLLANKDEDVQKLFEKCSRENINNEEIKYHLYRPNQTYIDFAGQLENILLPVYESAKNMGFNEWTY